MEARVAAISAGEAEECIWLVEHPPLYTAGTSARREDLTDPGRFPVYDSKRGGQYTYHGPGQRVAYVLLDVAARGRDVRCFVRQLEDWVITTLEQFNVTGEIRAGRVGVWVQRPEKTPQPDGTPAEDKIAAIGIRLRKWVSFHGIHQCGTGSGAFFRYRPLRDQRPRGHLAGGPRAAGQHGRCRRGPACGLRSGVRPPARRDRLSESPQPSDLPRPLRKTAPQPQNNPTLRHLAHCPLRQAALERLSIRTA